MATDADFVSLQIGPAAAAARDIAPDGFLF